MPKITSLNKVGRKKGWMVATLYLEKAYDSVN